MAKTSGKYKQLDMTRGGIFPAIVAFSIPLLFGSLFQTLYNTVDSVIIGNFVSTPALAAVGACYSPMMLLLSLMLGLSGGVSVLVSQVFGEKDEEKIREVVATANSFFLLAAIPMTVGALLMIDPVLNIIDVPEASRGHAQLYLTTIFAGLIAPFGYNLNAGLLHGLGDSRSPLLFLLVAFFVNTGLDFVFVLVLGWDVFGVAIATVIAQFVAWLYGVRHIRRHYPHLRHRLFSFYLNREHLGKILSLSLPLAMNHGVFSLGFLVYYRFVNGFGADFMAGYSIAGKLENLTWLPISSLGTAAVAFAGQNGGAGSRERLKKGVRLFLKTAVGINILTSVATLLCGRFLLGIFSSDPAVIEAGYRYLSCLLPFYWIYAIIHILAGFMNGVGDVRIPTLNTMVMFWGVRLPVAWYMSRHFSGEWLHIAYPISWAAGCLLTTGYFLTGRWKRKISEPALAESAVSGKKDSSDFGLEPCGT